MMSDNRWGDERKEVIASDDSRGGNRSGVYVIFTWLVTLSLALGVHPLLGILCILTAERKVIRCQDWYLESV